MNSCIKLIYVSYFLSILVVLHGKNLEKKWFVNAYYSRFRYVMSSVEDVDRREKYAVIPKSVNDGKVSDNFFMIFKENKTI